MTDKSKQGRANRNKGHNFEREFCAWVREEFGLTKDEFGRNLKQAMCSQEGDTDELYGFLPECKNHKTLNLRAFYGQAVESAKKRGLIPLLVYKVYRRGFRAVLPHPVAWDSGQSWRYDYEFSIDVGPACLAMLIRERL